MRNFPIKSSFQHSSIPLFQVWGNTQQPHKILLISICCRNSDISNYQTTSPIMSSSTGNRSIEKGEFLLDNKKELAVELRKMKI